MQKGNYSSRLNHSCDPNCATVSTIANSNYNLSLYATKSIEYGEELAYDYTVSTESKNDYKQSTCLCVNNYFKLIICFLISVILSSFDL